MSQDKNTVFAFLAGVLFGIAFISIYDRRRRKNRLKRLKEDLDKGFDLDRKNLKRDWRHVYSDLNKSYENLEKELNETY